MAPGLTHQQSVHARDARMRASTRPLVRQVPLFAGRQGGEIAFLASILHVVRFAAGTLLHWPNTHHQPIVARLDVVPAISDKRRENDCTDKRLLSLSYDP